MPCTEDVIYKLYYVHTMEYHRAVKMNDNDEYNNTIENILNIYSLKI